MTHKQKRILFNWLYKQGVLHKYKRARYTYSQMKSASFKSYRQMQFFGAIISGFDWACTLEGFLLGRYTCSMEKIFTKK